MSDQEIIEWIKLSKTNILSFFDKTIHTKSKSLLNLSLSGDVNSKDIKWGLAQATFFIRIAKIIGRLDLLDSELFYNFILSFQNKGFIYDKYLHEIKLGRRKRLKNAFLLKPQIYDYPVAVAESRQAIASLINLGFDTKEIQTNKLSNYYQENKDEIFESTLTHNNPWGLSSHINHLIFFSKYLQFDQDEYYRNNFEQWLLQNRNETDFSFADTKSSVAMKVGSTMKIHMALKSMNKIELGIHEKLVDFLLQSEANGDACELFNTIYILKNCLSLNYRINDIQQFARSKADVWLKYFYPEYGAFSFNENKSSTIYYSFKVAHGKPEPDYHGTAMFYWGFYMLSEILELQDKLKLVEPIL